MQHAPGRADVTASRSSSSYLFRSRSRSRSEILRGRQLDGSTSASPSSPVSSVLLPPPPPPPTTAGSDLSQQVSQRERSPTLSTPLHFDFTSSSGSNGGSGSDSSDTGFIGMSYPAVWTGRRVGRGVVRYRRGQQLAGVGAAGNAGNADRPNYIRDYRQPFHGDGAVTEGPASKGYEYDDEDSIEDVNPDAEIALLDAYEQEISRLRNRQRRLTHGLEASTALNRRLMLQNRALRAGIDRQASPGHLVRWPVAVCRFVRQVLRNWMQVLLWLACVALVVVFACRWYYKEDIAYMNRMSREMYGLSEDDVGWKWLWP
ncbi:hypothetical protein K431DRAFT_307911 [Polychaeton citri CBS 116435]|uniref:Uncharacterized protein n=1 Tax=Polychaeton citri CBS 116435 TaxID=1314669 RepID=A0A9P4UI00_9PEZI|nr:hypothetical protein K431DRAFT_307911 [Polychaeton citri CBS 116435]